MTPDDGTQPYRVELHHDARRVRNHVMVVRVEPRYHRHGGAVARAEFEHLALRGWLARDRVTLRVVWQAHLPANDLLGFLEAADQARHLAEQLNQEEGNEKG